MWRSRELNDIFVSIIDHSCIEVCWESDRVLENSVIVHYDSLFHATVYAYYIEQEIKAIDEMRRLTAIGQYHGSIVHP